MEPWGFAPQASSVQDKRSSVELRSRRHGGDLNSHVAKRILVLRSGPGARFNSGLKAYRRLADQRGTSFLNRANGDGEIRTPTHLVWSQAFFLLNYAPGWAGRDSHPQSPGQKPGALLFSHRPVRRRQDSNLDSPSHCKTEKLFLYRSTSKGEYRLFVNFEGLLKRIV